MSQLYDTFHPEQLAEMLENECTNGGACRIMSGSCWMCPHCQAAMLIRQWNRIWENDSTYWKVVNRETIDVDDETKRIRDERDKLSKEVFELNNMVFRLGLALDEAPGWDETMDFEQRVLSALAQLSAKLESDGV